MVHVTRGGGWVQAALVLCVLTSAMAAVANFIDSSQRWHRRFEARPNNPVILTLQHHNNHGLPLQVTLSLLLKP